MGNTTTGGRTPIDVWVWGFTPDEQQGWPEDLRPVDLQERLPAAGKPIVVHKRAVKEFRSAVDAQQGEGAGGRLPDALLYGADETALRGGIVAYFDGTVAARDWDALRAAVAHPRLYEALEWAEDVAVRPWAEAEYDLGPERLLAEALEQLPPEGRAAVNSDEACRDAFAAYMQERIQHWRQVVDPPAKRVVEYLRQPKTRRYDAWVETHLAHNLSARVAAASIDAELHPTPTLQLWVQAHLPALQDIRQRLQRTVDEQMEEVEQAIREQTEGAQAAIAALLDGLADRRVYASVPIGRRGRLRPGEGEEAGAGEREAPEPEQALQYLLERGGMDVGGVVEGVRRDLVIVLDDAQRAVILRSMREGTTPVGGFRVELRWEGEAWSADAEGGKVAIPLEVLERAVSADPPVDLTIWTDQPEEAA